MNKKILILIGMLLLVLTACGQNGVGDKKEIDKKEVEEKTNTNDTITDNKKLNVYASFYAMYDFANMIAGDKAEITVLVPAGAEPHDWEPTSKDMTGMTNADMIIYNGVDMEHWIDSVKSALANDNVKYVEASSGIELLGSDEELDPHVWLNPKNAAIELENIKNAFIEVDGQNKDFYEANYNEAILKINKLDEDFKIALKDIASRDIVVAHKAYGYLCDAYDLNQIAVESLMADGEPTPTRIAEIVEYIKSNNIKYIFFEELTNSKSVDIIANETGATILALNPYEGLTDEEIADGLDYFDVMYKNLENLKVAFNGIK